MNNKMLFLRIIAFIVGLILLVYFGAILILPKFLNNSKFVHYVEKKFNKKTNAELVIKNPKFEISPFLKLDVDVDNLTILNQKKVVLNVEDLSITTNVVKKSITSLNINKLEGDIDELRSLVPQKNSKSNFKLSYIPELSINLLKFTSQKPLDCLFEFKNVSVKYLNDKSKEISFLGVVSTNKYKNKLELSSQGDLIIKNNNLYAQNIEGKFDTFPVFLDGKVYSNKGNPNFKVYSKGLPVEDVLTTLLYYQKYSDPSKKFIENFKDYSGIVAFDLNYSREGIVGDIKLTDLYAKSVLFDVPITFKEALFVIKDNKMESVATGLLGNERVVHELNISNLSSKNRKTLGIVTATITPSLVREYLPKQYKVMNNVNAKVKYLIQNKKVSVDYGLDIDKGADVFYNDTYLGLRDKHRRLSANTYKDGDKLHLKNYKYDIVDSDSVENIVHGEGLFLKKNGHFSPQYVTCNTNGYAPTSVTGSFGRYVSGGFFKGNVRYDFNKEVFTGDFELLKTVFNNFFIESAKIFADSNKITMEGKGTYKHEKFHCKSHSENGNINERLHFYDMDLFLEKFVIQKNKTSKNHHNKKHIDYSEEVRNVDLDVDKFKIMVNTFLVNNVALHRVAVTGSLKDALFNFDIDDVNFANGFFNAEGYYNFNNDSSHLEFTAKNIDSNIVAGSIYNMNNQIFGIANATLKIDTYNKLDDIKGYSSFEIKDGFLPQLAYQTFNVKVLNFTKKIKLSKLTNADLTKKNSFKTTIKGSYLFDNFDLKNIRLTTQQEALSTYLEGEYDSTTQYADISLFGKYNPDNARRVKVLHVPLRFIISLILNFEKTKELYQAQLDRIPPINAKPAQERYFRVMLKGNLNLDNTDVEIKGIK